MIGDPVVAPVAPIRVHRKRGWGWNIPADAVYVGRPTVWGNPFIVGARSGIFVRDDGAEDALIDALTIEQCLTFYRDVVSGFLSPEMYPHGHWWALRFNIRYGRHPSEVVRSVLRGKPLCCWRSDGKPCHADILLEIANAKVAPQ